MSDLIQNTLRETLEKLADLECENKACPMAAGEAYRALGMDAYCQVMTLKQIAANADFEPWAANVAQNWLNENGY